MGKKGSWFSAIKRVFTHSSKDKPTDGSDKKSSKEKKKGKGVLRHSETKSFIPLFREPSSIEKILGEADQLLIRPHSSPEQPKTSQSLLERPISPKAPSPKTHSPRVISSPKAAPIIPEASSSRAVPTKVVIQSRNETSYVEPTLRNQHLSATKIQAAYRGYLGRRNFRALRGLVRLQGVVRGQNVKRQTVNAMKQMQLLVRVQTQIQSRRIQMLENQTFKEVETTLSKWTQLSERGENEDWDDSLLTKEEEEARLQKKVEAVIKRERAMAYAHSHQLWKSNPKSAQSSSDIRSNGFPWWWNWLERQLPPTTTTSQTKKITLTPPRPMSEYKQSPRLHGTHNEPPLTPQSSKSTIPFRNKHFHTPNRYPKPRTSDNDNDSLTSCPPFSVPNYMAHTVSAKAKARAYSNPKERVETVTPGSDSKRRLSFPLTPNIGSFKWNKGTNNNKETGSHKMAFEKHEPSRSIGDMSVDSAVSMPAAVGRKPFNRFV